MIAKSVALPAPTPPARSNTLTSAAKVAAARAACETDPAAYHAEVARRNLHWYHPTARAWFSFADGKWSGWNAQDASACELADGSWSPWRIALDDGKAPWFEWFVGARTSAAFNEVDRHVLAGHGAETAFIHCGPPAWEAARENGSISGACQQEGSTQRGPRPRPSLPRC